MRVLRIRYSTNQPRSSVRIVRNAGRIAGRFAGSRAIGDGIGAAVSQRMAFELARLGRTDLEALVALKLVDELGLGIQAVSALLARVDEGWMRRFLASGPAAIGAEPFGSNLLRRARIHRSRARHLIRRSP